MEPGSASRLAGARRALALRRDAGRARPARGAAPRARASAALLVGGVRGRSARRTPRRRGRGGMRGGPRRLLRDGRRRLDVGGDGGDGARRSSAAGWRRVAGAPRAPRPRGAVRSRRGGRRPGRPRDQLPVLVGAAQMRASQGRQPRRPARRRRVACERRRSRCSRGRQAATCSVRSCWSAAAGCGAAARDARSAAAREPTNWQPWLILARIEAERGRVPARCAPPAGRGLRTRGRRCSEPAHGDVTGRAGPARVAVAARSRAGSARRDRRPGRARCCAPSGQRPYFTQRCRDALECSTSACAAQPRRTDVPVEQRRRSPGALAVSTSSPAHAGSATVRPVDAAARPTKGRVSPSLDAQPRGRPARTTRRPTGAAGRRHAGRARTVARRLQSRSIDSTPSSDRDRTREVARSRHQRATSRSWVSHTAGSRRTAASRAGRRPPRPGGRTPRDGRAARTARRARACPAASRPRPAAARPCRARARRRAAGRRAPRRGSRRDRPPARARSDLLRGHRAVVAGELGEDGSVDGAGHGPRDRAVAAVGGTRSAGTVARTSGV